MKIACLGWGSLIWDPRTLPVSSDWLNDGPLLPVEFTRQSNDGRITLAITPDACAVKVFSALLDVLTMDEACRALAEREGIPAKFITRSVGHWAASSQSDHPQARAVGDWAMQAGYEGVVWTALQPKFDKAYVTPSCTQVLAYLGGLSGDARKGAEIYVRRTPAAIRTAYRDEIERALGWTRIVDA